MKKKKHFLVWRILLCLAVILVLMLLIFMHFGGFGTGESADPEEFAAYSMEVDEISIPDAAKVIALGEATHGNSEFQKLKLDVFKRLVEQYDVRAFVIEGDYGGCEKVNRYIHGGSGTAQEAAESIGFQIYQTGDIAELIEFMRQYNEYAPEGEDLRFYGFDMQRYMNSFDLLVNECEANNIDAAALKNLVKDDQWNDLYDDANRADVINSVKDELAKRENTALAIHAADMLLQYCELQASMENADSAMLLRDEFMAKNVEWVLQQENLRGHERIFITGHNSHVAKWESYDSVGKQLQTDLGDGYYVIGTDFYKTKCNLPTPSGKRTNQVFYSHDPLAKAAKKAHLDVCWLDFSKIPEDSKLGTQIREYSYMGDLGEQYTPFMRLLPPSYRLFQPPAQMYDGMIFVTEATPIVICTDAKQG